jgi:DNA-binding CsgD family transcriptional regulator
MDNYQHISQEMKEKGSPFFDMLGINAYSVRRFYCNGTKVYLSTIPEWFQFYKNHKFYKLGEFNSVLTGEPSFKLWDYWDKNDKDFWKVINPARDYFNQNHGLCYIKKNKTYIDILNFGADKKDRRINERYLNEKERIKKFYDYLEATVIDSLVQKAPKFKLERTEVKPCILNGLFENLSPQESRILNLWAQGYTLKQIAYLISISARTVETYVERIKIKTGCKYKTQLMERYHLYPIMTGKNSDSNKHQ